MASATNNAAIGVQRRATLRRCLAAPLASSAAVTTSEVTLLQITTTLPVQNPSSVPDFEPAVPYQH
jgi:hypothetical protein